MLGIEDLLAIERENDPLAVNLYEMAQQYFGKDPYISEDEKSVLHQLNQRANRLGPMNMARYGEVGGGAIPGNPYSVDRRGLFTGLNNLAVGLINRERNRRVEGDPKAVARAERRASTLNKELEGIRNKENPSESDMKRAERLEKRINRQERRAGRYTGFKETLDGLRQLQTKEDARQEDIRSFINRIAPEHARIIFQDNLEDNRLNRSRRHITDDADRKLQDDLKLIQERGNQDRLTLRERNRLENDPNSPQSKQIVYSELNRIMNLLNPDLSLLPGEIQNLRVAERQLMSRGLTGEDPEIADIRAQIEAAESSYREISRRAANVFFQARPELRNRIDVDSILNDMLGTGTGTSRGEFDDL